jgi:hypothetical protein
MKRSSAPLALLATVALLIPFQLPLLAGNELWILDPDYDTGCFQIFRPGSLSMHKGDLIVIRFYWGDCPLYYWNIDAGDKGTVSTVNGGWHSFEPSNPFENRRFAVVIKAKKRGSDTLVITLNDEHFVYNVTVS